MNNKKIIVQNSWIDWIGIIAILLACFGYVLFGASFAQVRLEASFLSFPIFIGEILLAFTGLLYIVKTVQQKQKFGFWMCWLGVYLFFVLLKAFTGYFAWGPLAFRDAALFYYPIFAVLGYSFWPSDCWGENLRRIFFIIILILLISHQYAAFWPCSLFILGSILALQAKSLMEKMFLISIIFIFAPYGSLFNPFFRTTFLSSLITVFFIGIVFIFLLLRKRWMRIIGLVVIGIVLGVVLYEFSQTGVWSTFLVKDAKPLATNLPSEVPRGKYIFHPVGSSVEKPDSFKVFFQRVYKTPPRIVKGPALQGNVKTVLSAQVEKKSYIDAHKTDLRIKKDDARFRYYIWRDMWHEYYYYKPLLGFDFGRPLRCRTMEYYGISSTEDIDGWIGAHNSLFYIIYRTGIIGVLVIVCLLIVWIKLFRGFYKLRDWIGILLCAILLNWFVSANFFLILELPYTAVPIWTILGITLKYRTGLK